MDSNHRRHSQQIYSLPPLATWVTLPTLTFRQLTLLKPGRVNRILRNAKVNSGRRWIARSGENDDHQFPKPGKYRLSSRIPHRPQYIHSAAHSPQVDMRASSLSVVWSCKRSTGIKKSLHSREFSWHLFFKLGKLLRHFLHVSSAALDSGLRIIS